MVFLSQQVRSLAAVVLVSFVLGCQKGSQRADPVTPSHLPRRNKAVTFNSVAPIIWDKCACCHREGEAAPFPLIEFSDVQKRAKQVRQVIESGYMPPWLPETADVKYENDSRLTPDQKQSVLSWLENGLAQGPHELLPAKPNWTSGWQFGKPDLVVSLPQPFMLSADGPDIYRNFVVPIPTNQIRYVRAMEFRPTNYRVVHHAFMLIDPTRQLRRITQQDGQPGFDGMDVKTAMSPGGYFIGWQPGRRPHAYPPDMAWQLLPGTDLVLQMHMRCTGKPEKVGASVGVFFTEERPTRLPSKLLLRSTEIDIPAGAKDYEIEDSMRLPVEVEVMAIAPHAHYLGKEMYGFAELPDGTTKTLLSIKDWDLNWQSEYRFKPWVRLPAGTVLRQRFVYDNSDGNIRNPHIPPERVTFGPQATDEMGSLWFQVVPVADADQTALKRAIVEKETRDIIARKRKVLVKNPNDFDANLQMGKLAIAAKRFALAFRYAERAALADPRSAEARYYLGHALLRNGQLDYGVEQLQECLKHDSQYLAAHYDLGRVAVMQGNWEQAESQFRKALAIHEFDAASLKQLGQSLLSRGKTTEALMYLRKSLSVNPTDAALQQLVKEHSEQSELR